MCSHCQAVKRRKLIEKRCRVTLPPSYEPGPSSHIYPTYEAPIIRRPAERDSAHREAHPDQFLCGRRRHVGRCRDLVAL